MDKALNEIGKLRNEMKIGFIELENQMKAGSEQTQSNIGQLQAGIVSLRDEMKGSNDRFIKTLDKFSKNVEAGFLAIEDALENDIKDIKSELSSIKSRLDKANL